MTFNAFRYDETTLTQTNLMPEKICQATAESVKNILQMRYMMCCHIILELEWCFFKVKFEYLPCQNLCNV